MDITLRSSDLVKELSYLEKAVSPRPTLPILTNVLCEAEGEGVKLSATNLEIGLVTSCSARIDMPGKASVPAKRLFEIVKLLGDAPLRLTLDETALRLSAGAYNARLQTLPASDFPQMPSMKDLVVRQVPRTALRSLALKTRYATTEKDSRYFMNGALLVLGEESMMMVATDSLRLAQAAAPYNGGVEAPAIIANAALDKLIDLLGEGAEPTISFAQSDRHLFFIADGRLLVSRVISSPFPSYTRILPKEEIPGVEISVPFFKLAVQRVGLMADDLRAVKLEVRGTELSLTAPGTATGDAVERVNVVYSGEPISTAANWKYVLDFLDAVDQPTITLCVKENDSPLLFKEGTTYRYVVMPIRL